MLRAWIDAWVQRRLDERTEDAEGRAANARSRLQQEVDDLLEILIKRKETRGNGAAHE